jgi:hypothetical protein
MMRRGKRYFKTVDIKTVFKKEFDKHDEEKDKMSYQKKNVDKK